MLVLYFLFVLIFLCILHLFLNYNEQARLIRKIPGPKDNFIIGNMMEILSLSPEQLFALGRKYAATFDGIYRFWAYPIRSVFVCNPEDIEIVVSSMKHTDKGILYKFLKPWLNDGLLLSKGEKWLQRRKILTPTFHFNILRQFCLIFEENNLRLGRSLKLTDQKAVNIMQILSDYTLHTICETAMGTPLDETSNTGKSYKEAVYKIGLLLIERLISGYLMSDFLFSFTSIYRQQLKYLTNLHNFTNKVIRKRKRYIKTHGASNYNVGEPVTTTKKKTAMLDLLILAENDGLLNEDGIREEVDTFMFEGHDTTACGLTYLLLSIANNKHIQDKVVAELNKIFGENERPASIEDLAAMRYLECCIKETLRLYPPVPFLTRTLSETVKLSNYTVPAGTECIIQSYDLHRREDLYVNAHKFDPDRFLPENCVGRHPFAYIPFSAGPRNCIGQKFAMLEMKSCAAAVLRHFELHPVTRECDVRFKSDVVLRSAEPILLKFVERNTK
ncbi:cytochrome P450 4c3-like [Hyposmocoma kahamanoa]|uniref:cytochrome P450 4c3-like n=1 Tax=Hyposmocoma kahamanoa TaxID=1477025 RepID=UPI000E6D8853|nr:cytochrome P450 4c3-like [Hyposmocoma kahamanoa]